MKTTNKNKHVGKKLGIILGLIVGIVFTGLVIYLVVFKGSLFGWQPFGTTVTVDPPTQSSSDTNHGTKDDATDIPTDNTSQIPVSETLIASIDELSQSGGYIRFSGSANDTKTGGSCSIVFSNPNDRPISRTADATISSGKALCGPIKVAETEFSYLGEWTMTFRYYSGKSQAVSERKIIIQ